MARPAHQLLGHLVRPLQAGDPLARRPRKQYAGQGFEILGIDTEDDDVTPADKPAWAKDKTAVAQFVQKEHMPYPVLVNGDSISHEYGDFEAMPTSFFVNRSGKIIAAEMGITSEDDMALKIRQALSQ